jgi:hypothetical protein
MGDAMASIGRGWHGPGWYIMMDTPMTQTLYQGAYATQADCEAALPASHNGMGYECVKLTHEPLD